MELLQQQVCKKDNCHDQVFPGKKSCYFHLEVLRFSTKYKPSNPQHNDAFFVAKNWLKTINNFTHFQQTPEKQRPPYITINNITFLPDPLSSQQQKKRTATKRKAVNESGDNEPKPLYYPFASNLASTPPSLPPQGTPGSLRRSSSMRFEDSMSASVTTTDTQRQTTSQIERTITPDGRTIETETRVQLEISKASEFRAAFTRTFETHHTTFLATEKQKAADSNKLRAYQTSLSEQLNLVKSDEMNNRSSMMRWHDVDIAQCVKNHMDQWVILSVDFKRTIPPLSLLTTCSLLGWLTYCFKRVRALYARDVAKAFHLALGLAKTVAPLLGGGGGGVSSSSSAYKPPITLVKGPKVPSIPTFWMVPPSSKTKKNTKKKEEKEEEEKENKMVVVSRSWKDPWVFLKHCFGVAKAQSLFPKLTFADNVHKGEQVLAFVEKFIKGDFAELRSYLISIHLIAHSAQFRPAEEKRDNNEEETNSFISNQQLEFVTCHKNHSHATMLGEMNLNLLSNQPEVIVWAEATLSIPTLESVAEISRSVRVVVPIQVFYLLCPRAARQWYETKGVEALFKELIEVRDGEPSFVGDDGLKLPLTFLNQHADMKNMIAQREEDIYEETTTQLQLELQELQNMNNSWENNNNNNNTTTPPGINYSKLLM